MIGASKISAPKSDGARLPGLSARLMLGGKVNGYQGMLPGLFEETLLSFRPPPVSSFYVPEPTNPPRGKSASASLP